MAQIEEQELFGILAQNRYLIKEFQVKKKDFRKPLDQEIFLAIQTGREIVDIAKKYETSDIRKFLYINETIDGRPKTLDARKRAAGLLLKIRSRDTKKRALQLIDQLRSKNIDDIELNEIESNLQDIKDKKIEYAANESNLLSFQSIQEKKIQWHVPGIYAAGMIHILGGVQGHGKSLHLIDLSARTSTGTAWPITGEPIPKGDVLYITDEDSKDKIIKPRLRLAGADMSRIFIPDFDVEDLALPKDSFKLEAWTRKLSNPKLVILDPIADYSEGSLNPSEEAIKIVRPLKQIAEKTGVCLIYAVHFNKKVDIDSIHRVAHSYVLTSKPRLVWFVIKQDPDDDLNPHRLFCCGKTAFKPIPNMIFTIREDDDEIPFIDEWRTVKTQTSEALATSERRRDLKVQEAEEFLMRIMNTQPLYVEDIMKLASKEDINERNIYRARNNLAISDDYDDKGRKFWVIDKPVKPKMEKIQ